MVAEDPAAGWMPSTGRIDRFHIGDGVRVDTGVQRRRRDLLRLRLARGEGDRPRADPVGRGPGVGAGASGVADHRHPHERRFVGGDLRRAGLPRRGDADGLPRRAPRGADTDRSGRATIGSRCCSGAVFALEQEHRSTDRATPFAPSGWRNLRTQGQRQVWIESTGEHLHVEYEMAQAWQADGSTEVGRVGSPRAVAGTRRDRRAHRPTTGRRCRCVCSIAAPTARRSRSMAVVRSSTPRSCGHGSVSTTTGSVRSRSTCAARRVR